MSPLDTTSPLVVPPDSAAVLEAIPDAVLLVDAGGRITYANRQVEALWGVPRASVLAVPVDTLLREVAGAASLKRTDGMVVPVDVVRTSVTLGAARYVMCTIRDVSWRASMQAELDESRQRYRMLVERASEVFYEVAVDGDPYRGRVTFVSPQCQRLTGSPPEAFLEDAHRWIALVHPEDVPALARQTEVILASREEGTRYYRLGDGTGRLRYVEDRIVPLVDGQGTVVGYQGVARDITPRVEAEEQRRRAADALRTAERVQALGQLAAGIAHDFNNILTVILGFSSSAQSTLGDPRQTEHDLREIDAAAQRAGKLVKQLLAFSRRQQVEPAVLDLAAHLRSADAMVRQAATEQVTVRFDLEPSTWPIYMDPSQVDQIVLNLVTNARDAMPRGGLLEVTVRNIEFTPEFCATHPGAVAGDYVALRVRDTGAGMAPDVLAHAFEPFFTTKPEGLGTGIGLASVYGIVKQNRGYVQIESEVGKGTVVSVYLPRHAGSGLAGAGGIGLR